MKCLWLLSLMILLAIATPVLAGPLGFPKADGAPGPTWAYGLGWTPDGSKLMVVRLFRGSQEVATVERGGWPFGKESIPVTAIGFFPKDKTKDILYFDTQEEMLIFLKEDVKHHMK